MGAAHAVSLLLAGSASVAGIVIVGVMWHRSRHRARAHLTRHPSTQPPITVRLQPTGNAHRWRIDNRPSAPTVAIDIVSYRPARAGEAWESEPIVDPIVIEPGASRVLPSNIDRVAERFEVVIAWTARLASGDVQGSRTFEVPEPSTDARGPAESPRAVISWRSALVLTGVLTSSVVLAGLSAAGTFGDDGGLDLPLPTTTAVELPSQIDPPTDDSSTSAEPAEQTASTARTTVPGTNTAATNRSSTTTGVPTTTSTVASLPATAGGPTISVDGQIGPCRYGTQCLIAGFTIDGFAVQPREYTCEFEDGSRSTFRFDSDRVDDACATATTTAEITIEIAGVRSDILTRANL